MCKSKLILAAIYSHGCLMSFCGDSQVLWLQETKLHSHQGVPWDSSICCYLFVRGEHSQGYLYFEQRAWVLIQTVFIFGMLFN